MNFNLSWHLENWNSPCDEVDYCKKTSLFLLLKKEKIDDKDIDKILSSKTMFWDASKKLNPIDKISNNTISIFNDEASRFRKMLFLRTIESSRNQEVFEIFFYYLLMIIAVTISWDFQKQNTSYEQAYINFLSELNSKNQKYIYKILGKTEISCFFLAHKRSNQLLEEIIDSGLEYIKINSRSKNTPLGNIYLTMKPEVIDAVIKKIFEIIYTYPEFNIKDLLFKEHVLNELDTSIMKYDVKGLKQQHGFYLIPENMQDTFFADISMLNPIIENAMHIEKNLNNCLLKKECLNFNVLSDDNNNFCYIKYEPLTETGKKSKYPIILHFNNKDGSFTNDLFGEVYLMDKNVIGKAIIIYWKENKSYVINITRDDNTLQLSKLETRDSNGNPIVLYKKTKT
jgi:hypothetical protein